MPHFRPDEPPVQCCGLLMDLEGKANFGCPSAAGHLSYIFSIDNSCYVLEQGLTFDLVYPACHRLYHN